MKRIFTSLLITVFFVPFTYSQLIPTKVDDIENNYFLGAEYNSFFITHKNTFAPMLLIQTYRLEIKLGPILNNTDGIDVRGGMAAIQFRPNPEAKIFDFFFLFQGSTTEQYYSYYNPSEKSLIERTTLSLGYGFNLKLIENLYLTSNFSLGYTLGESINTKYSLSGQFERVLVLGVGYKIGLD